MLACQARLHRVTQYILNRTAKHICTDKWHVLKTCLCYETNQDSCTSRISVSVIGLVGNETPLVEHILSVMLCHASTSCNHITS